MSEHLRLCDDQGMISDEPVEPGSPGSAFDPELTYLGLLNNLRAHTGHGPVGSGWACTGDAHLAGMHFVCTSPAHQQQGNPAWARMVSMDEVRVLLSDITPGPWVAAQSLSGSWLVHDSAETGPLASDCLEHNALLVAAAPDLAHTAAVLGEQREAVLALHNRVGSATQRGFCAHCRRGDGSLANWPCPTARALGVT